MRYYWTLGISLFIIWLAWSGHYQPLPIALGGLSCLVVVVFSIRMRLYRNTAGFRLSFARCIAYVPWLCLEIIKANLDVARRILDPVLPIEPRMLKFRCSQYSSLGRVILANSITLTPGTVSVDLNETEITVHALTREAADSLLVGEMDRRVSDLENIG